ncbi:MAG: universal stress protein [Halobacteriota archaeon]
MRILYATDLSEASDAAVRTQPCLDCLTRIGTTEVHLVTVISSDMHYGMPGIDYRKTKQNLLKGQKRIFTEAGFDVETHIVRGTPHRRINGVAEAVNADIIVIGSRGESPLKDRFIGSTARNMARTAVRPLVLQRISRSDGHYRVARQHLFNDLLYATDFSSNAERAFQQFETIQNATQHVTLLHVIERSKHDEDEIESLRGDAREKLAAHADTLAGYDIDTDIEIRVGDPLTEILDTESTVSPTMTLLGSRGKGRLRRLLLGSVSERVVARAEGNVLLVPPQSR